MFVELGGGDAVVADGTDFEATGDEFVGEAWERAERGAQT